MWRVALAACAIALCLMLFVRHQAEKIERLQEEAAQREIEIRTHERIRDADVSRGDPDDDASWLCARSGRRDCGS